MQGIKNLTQGPINRQLFNLAMPIMATSFIQMAYSLTDMAWVGRLGSEAVAAIGSVGILTWMSGSISLLNKVGAEGSKRRTVYRCAEPGRRPKLRIPQYHNCFDYFLVLGRITFHFRRPYHTYL